MEVCRNGTRCISTVDRRPLIAVITCYAHISIELAGQRRVERERRGEELGKVRVLCEAAHSHQHTYRKKKETPHYAVYYNVKIQLVFQSKYPIKYLIFLNEYCELQMVNCE